eukprot:gene4354-14474_t
MYGQPQPSYGAQGQPQPAYGAYGAPQQAAPAAAAPVYHMPPATAAQYGAPQEPAAAAYPQYQQPDMSMGQAAAGQSAANPALQQLATMMPGMNPQQLQSMYQQYAMRWAAMQQGGPMDGGMGMGHHGGMGGGMGGPMGGGGMGGVPFDTQLLYKTKMCMKWQEGSCSYGETCKYAHGDHELRVLGPNGQVMGGVPGMGMPSMPGGPPDKRVLINALKKTRLCQDFTQTGTCRYAEKCTFAHGQHEMREAPDLRNGIPPSAYVSAGQPIPKQALKKTKLCNKFVEAGVCSYGDRCSFAHGQFELRQLDDPAPTLPVKRVRLDGAMTSPVVGAKKAHVAEETFPEPTCAMCALLCKTGRAQNPKAKQLGIMIMAASSRLDQLWDKCTPTMVMGWLSKIDGLSVQDRVEVLKAVTFHVHGADASTRSADGGMGLDSQKYIDMGLPAEAADFVYVCMDGKEAADFVYLCMDDKEV